MWRNNGTGLPVARILLVLIGLLVSAGPAVSNDAKDWITGLPREPIHVAAWPGGKKVAICFVLYVGRRGSCGTAPTNSPLGQVMGAILMSSMNRFASTP